MGALRALGWDHPRCLEPMRRAAAAWRALTGIDVRWDARSLEDFGDGALGALDGYDLAVVDHPTCGAAALRGVLAPLDDAVDVAVGPSHASYRYDGRQWALPVDAACQVQALRGGGPPAPATWDDALALARELGSRAAVPLAPAHALSSYLTLSANAGRDPLAPGGDEVAAALLLELAAAGPAEARGWEPPDVLARIAAGALDYVPLVYGYVTYAGRVSFADVPSAGRGPVGAVLGGAGIAVVAGSPRSGDAVRFAAWVASPAVQRDVVLPAGGQPAARAAWDAAPEPARARFFAATRASVEAAWVRPRDPWWQRFQQDGGVALQRGLASGRTPAQLARALDEAAARARGAARA